MSSPRIRGSLLLIPQLKFFCQVKRKPAMRGRNRVEDNLAGLIEPMLDSAGACIKLALALLAATGRELSDDRPVMP
jgi:hypothetical protein